MGIAPGIAGRGKDNSYVDGRVPAGIAAETAPRWAIQAAIAPSAGKVYLHRITLLPGAYSTVSFLPGATNAASALNVFFGLYDAITLAKVAASADLTAGFNALTAKTTATAAMAFTATTTKDYYLAFVMGTVASVTLHTVGLSSADVGSLSPVIFDRHNASVVAGALPDPAVLQGGVTGQIAYWLRYA